MHRPDRSLFLLPLLGGAVALAVGACASVQAGGARWVQAPPSAPLAAAPAAVSISRPTAAPAAPAAPAAASSAPVALNLTILSDTMTGKAGWPVFVPTDLSLPAHATVQITVTNFDGATPLPTGSARYAQASGVVGGTFTVTPIAPGDPNGSAGPAATRTALDPSAVSHTFTILALGINVPLAANARTTFTIHTGAPGTFTWKCFDPCGTGPDGWGGPMSHPGYMDGTVTIAG